MITRIQSRWVSHHLSLVYSSSASLSFEEEKNSFRLRLAIKIKEGNLNAQAEGFLAAGPER